MAQRSRYGAFTGFKSMWDASSFSRGVKYTNEALREGEARAFVNLDISKSGSSLKPRHPYVNALFRLREGDNEIGLPFSLPKDTVLFRPLQDMGHEYLIALSGKHKDQNRVVELRWNTVEERPYVIDGDTFQFNGVRYRLLGIDTPELGTEPDALVAAKLLDAFFGRAFIEAENSYGVNVVYDSGSIQDVDVYGRHLVWLQAVETTSIRVYTYILIPEGVPSEYPEAPVWDTNPRGVVVSNIDDPNIVIHDDRVFELYTHPYESWPLPVDGIYNELVYGNGYAKLFGEYSGYGTEDNPIVFPKYNYIDMEAWTFHLNTYVVFVDTSVGFPSVYKKDTNQKLKSFQEYNETVDGDYELTSTKIPYIPIEDVSNIIDITGVWSDLDLQYNYPIGVRQLAVIREEDKEYFKMSQELKSKTGLSYYDGIMFIGEVFVGEEILYRGPMSFRYDVPLADDNVTVAWDKARIKINTYKKPYRVAYDELTDVSPNLLDGEPLFTGSLFGEEAIEEGFSYPTLRSILISDSPNETTKLFSKLKYGKRYYIHPMVALPPLSDENGLSGYDGYAYKWIVTKIGSQVVTQEPTPSSELIYTTINEYSEELPSGSTTGLVGDSCSILGELRWTSTKVSRPAERHWATRTETEYITSGSTRTILGDGDLTNLQNPELGLFVKVIKNPTVTTGSNKFINIGYEMTEEGNVIWSDFVTSRDRYNLKSFNEIKRTFRSPLIINTSGVGLGTTTANLSTSIRNQMNAFIQANPKSYVILRQSGANGVQENYYFIPFYSGLTYDYYERVFATPLDAHQRIICSDEPTTVEGNWIVGFDSQANPIDLSKWVLHNQMPEFSDSQQGILVTLMVAPVNYEVVGDEISITTAKSTMESTSFVLTSASYLYSKDEEIMPLKQDNENIYTAKYITSFDGRVVLYGTEKFPNIIYLSGTLGYKDIQEPLSYFPLRYAQDQFDSPVVHCLPYMDTLIVFTENDIWQLANVPSINEETGVSTDEYYAKKIVNNISLDFFDKETVRITNKHVVFMSNNTLYALRPNIYAEGQDLYLNVLSTNIHDLLGNPVDFLWERLRQRNIVFDVDRDDMYPTVSYFVSTSDNEISLFISMYLDDKELPYMVECRYDMEFGRWVIYDNIACSYPIQFGIHDAVDGPFYLMKNHPTIDYGVTYMKKVGINSWDFEEPYGKQFDIKAVKVSRPVGMEPTFIFNSALVRKYNTVTQELEEEKELIEGLVKVKQPINMLIDTGAINVGQHVFKRFHQMHLEISNVDAVSMGAAVAFNVDGSPRQTGTVVRVVIKDTGQGYAVPELTETVELNYTDYDELLLSTKLYNWQLDVSGFLALGRVLLKFPISGRGRVPHGKFILECANKIEIYRYGFVFKEQSMR